jgi:hypothetical protein
VMAAYAQPVATAASAPAPAKEPVA